MVLLNHGVDRLAAKFLRFLPSNLPEELDFGITAASITCRLVPDSDAIRTNGFLIKKIAWLLSAVLDAGPGGRVLGYSWNPANIVYDVLVLSKHPRNKPLLASFVELLLVGMEQRPENVRLVCYSVEALSNLLCEPVCREVLEGSSVQVNMSTVLQIVSEVGNEDLIKRARDLNEMLDGNEEHDEEDEEEHTMNQVLELLQTMSRKIDTLTDQVAELRASRN